MENQALAANQERMVEFKKTLFGVNEKEVFEYIDLLNDNLNKAHQVFEEKLAEMKSANELLSYERAGQEEKLHQLSKSCQTLIEECDQLKQTVVSQQDLADDVQQVKQENTQLQKRIENCLRIEEENQLLKKQLVENNVVCQMREQEQSKLSAEIEELKKQNKDMLESFLDERNQLKSDAAEKNLKLTQALQMHRYSLEQSRKTLENLVTQFDEACTQAGQIQAD